MTIIPIEDLGDASQIRISRLYKLGIFQITMDSSYPTGGEALDLNRFGYANVHAVFFENIDTYTFGYNKVNKKIKVYGYGLYASDADSFEIANGTNLSSVSVYMIVLGRE